MQGDMFGSYTYLCEYETERSRHNLPTALTIDGIQKLYSTNFDLVVLARSLGVQVQIDYITATTSEKRAFAHDLILDLSGDLNNGRSNTGPFGVQILIGHPSEFYIFIWILIGPLA